GAEPVAQHRLDLSIDPSADILVILRRRNHVLAQYRDPHAGERLRILLEHRVGDDEARIGLLRNQRLRDRRERIPRVVVPELRILERIEHLRGIGERARVDTGAIVEPLVADAAAVREDTLRRQYQCDTVSRRRSLARRAGLLADPDHREVSADRRARASARAPYDALGVVRVAGLPAPRAHLLPARDPVQLLLVGPAGIPGARVELVRVRLRIDDRAFLA